MIKRRIWLAAVVTVLAAFGIGLWIGRPPPLPNAPRFTDIEHPQARLWIRTDQTEARGLEIRARASELVLWLESPVVLGPVRFQISGRASRIRVRSGRAASEYAPESHEHTARFFFDWQPRNPRRDRAHSGFFYRLVLSFPDWKDATDFSGKDGPSVVFLGLREFLEQDYYAADWRGCGAPEAVATGESFLVSARLQNRSPYAWPHSGPARVRWSVGWFEADGKATGIEEIRQDLRTPTRAGEELSSWLKLRAPERPGRHRIELDLVFEPFHRFSERGVATCQVELDVR